MACATQVFDNVTRERFNCLVQKAAASGITIDGDEGQTVIKHGLVSAQISWNFDEGA